MIRTITIVSLALFFSAAAHADPLRLGDAQMDGVTAGQSAKNPYYAITGDSSAGASTTSTQQGVFKPSGLNSIYNSNNPALRFGRGGAIAVPGKAGLHANKDSAVKGYKVNGLGSSTIIRPPGHN